jgi:CRP-like cAMP-binding protein
VESVLEVLRAVDLLEGVDDAALLGLEEVGRIRDFRAGETVIRQGEFGDSFFVLVSGRVRVRAVGDDGRMQDLAQLGPADYFGELAMLGHGERGASVECVADSRVIELRQVPFQKAVKRFKKVKTRLETAYARRALTGFFRQSRYFRDLPEPMKDELVAASSLSSYSKDDVIVAEGDKADRFYVVRSGFVRVSRKVPGADQDEILAYLGVEDFFGDQELSSAAEQYAASVVAVEPVECISVPRVSFWKLNREHQEVFAEFRRYQIARREQAGVLAASRTSMAFVKDVLESGLGQARSALIINMDACVRCGNCVQACDDLHGYSRLARRGKKLTRRVELESRAHESLYFPTSCLQCATPECMVGCPTGAISRDPGGEVFVRDTCIGCGSCARNCDFGNISMAEARHSEPSILDRVKAARSETSAPAKPDLVAVKCDVCFERDHAACVYNCPTQAILRIDPRSYFAELARIAPRAAHREALPAKTTTRRPTRWIDGVLQLLTALVSVIGGYAAWLRLSPAPWSALAWGTGIGAAACMVLLGLLGARKRLRTVRLGALSGWVQVHAVLGGAFYGLVLFHAGYRAESTLTAALLVTVTVVCVIGALGQIANALLPRLISRTEDESLLPEDVVPQLKRLVETNRELLDALEPRARRRVERRVSRLARGVWTSFARGHSPSRIARLVEERAAKLPALEASEQAVAVRVAENELVAALARIGRGLEILMTSWVPVHLVSSCAAFLLLLGHVVTVLLW